MVKRRYGRGNTPATTSEKWTGVRDPRATVRFSLDERVAWDEGDRIILGVVIGFLDDECAIKVRLENGSTVVWPTVSARLRRVQTPDYDSGSVATQVEPPTITARFGELIPIDEPLGVVVEVGAVYEGEAIDDGDVVDGTAVTVDLDDALTHFKKKRRDP